jgi:hypothetical protein
MRSSATGGVLSGLNDLLVEIGSMGIKSVWPEIHRYLQANSSIKHVEIFGKSLGGGHAQQLTVLIEGIANLPVHKLTTSGSVGVSVGVNALFSEVRQKYGHEMEVNVLRNGGSDEADIDHVPCFGGDHLGGDDVAHTSTKVYYLNGHHVQDCAAQGNSAIYTGKLSFWKSVAAFFRSFGSAHLKQVTLDLFSWRCISSKDDSCDFAVQLQMGRGLETWRKILAYTLHIFTFGLLNGHSFTHFYREQEELQRKDGNQVQHDVR